MSFMFTDNNQLLKKLYEKLNEIEIFSYALDLPMEKLLDIIYKNQRFHIKKYVNSQSPSFAFALRNRKNGATYLYLKSFADDKYCGDCIHFTALKLGKTLQKQGFVDTIKHLLDRHLQLKNINSNIDMLNIVENKLILQYRAFTKYDYNYFSKFGITPLQVQRLYKPILNIYNASKDDIVYLYKPTNPCYMYVSSNFAQNPSYKLYFPAKKVNKFYTINGSVIFEDDFIFENKNKYTSLIITKSLKDKMCIQNVLREIGDSKTKVTNVSSETVNFEEYIELLISLYGNVYTFYDLDYTGIKMSRKYDKLDIPSLLPNRGIITVDVKHYPRSKDFAELYSKDKKTAMLYAELIKKEIKYRQTLI